MTITRKYTQAFTAPNPNKPIINHAPGVSTVNHRWLASRQSGAVGSTITSLTPSVGSLVLADAGTGPTLQLDELGRKVIRTDGVNDILTAGSITDVGTMIVVARTRKATGTDQGIFHTGGAYMRRNTTDGVAVTVTGTTNKFPAVNPNMPLYHFFALATTSTTSRYLVDGVSLDLGATTGTHTQITLGRAGTSIFGELDIYEVLTTSNALTLAQMADVRAALKLFYGASLA